MPTQRARPKPQPGRSGHPYFVGLRLTTQHMAALQIAAEAQDVSLAEATRQMIEAYSRSIPGQRPGTTQWDDLAIVESFDPAPEWVATHRQAVGLT